MPRRPHASSRHPWPRLVADGLLLAALIVLAVALVVNARTDVVTARRIKLDDALFHNDAIAHPRIRVHGDALVEPHAHDDIVCAPLYYGLLGARAGAGLCAKIGHDPGPPRIVSTYICHSLIVLEGTARSEPRPPLCQRR